MVSERGEARVTADPWAGGVIPRGDDEDGAVSVLEDTVGHRWVHELLEPGAAVGAGHNEVRVELFCHLGDGVPYAGGVLHEVAFSILHTVFFGQFGAFEGEVAGIGEAGVFDHVFGVPVGLDESADAGGAGCLHLDGLPGGEEDNVFIADEGGDESHSAFCLARAVVGNQYNTVTGGSHYGLLWRMMGRMRKPRNGCLARLYRNCWGCSRGSGATSGAAMSAEAS